MLKLFNKTFIGLDISDNSVELVKINKSGSGIKIINLNRVKFSDGIVVRGKIKNKEKLKVIIDKAFGDVSRAVDGGIIFGLPESQAYNLIIKIKSGGKKEDRESLILKNIKRNIPIESNDLIYNYKSNSKQGGTEEILVVASSKKVVDGWSKFFRENKLSVKFFDSELLSTFRGLSLENNKSVCALVDIGANTTNIGIFDKGVLRYSHTLSKAGNFLTKSLASALKIDIDEAEKEKKVININNADEKANVIIKSLQPILTELQTSLGYFEKKNKIKIEKIILVGGSSKLKGLVDYLSSNLSLPVEIGKSNLKDKRSSLLYVEAIGLALGGISNTPMIIPGVNKKIATLKKKNLPKEQGVEKNKTVTSSSGGNSQKIILLLVLVIGLASIFGAYMYRQNQKESLQTEREELAQQYNFSRIFNLKIPVATDPSEYTADRIRGKVVTSELLGDSQDGVLIDQMKSEIEGDLSGGEQLWLEPLEIKVGTRTSDPTVFNWLVFSDNSAQKLFIEGVKDEMGDDFLLKVVDYQAVIKTDNPNIFLMSASVDVFSN